MRNPFISIVIPVYNVAEYLERCLNTIEFCLTRGFELIIVNDGSTDSSLQIAKTFIEKYPDVKLIDLENGGQSRARDYGLGVATGEYVWFIDSDDYISEKDVLPVLEKLNKDKPDLIVFGRVEEYSKSRIYAPHGIQPKDYTLGTEYFINAVRIGEFRTQPWDKIIRRSVLEKHNIKFAEGLIYEDMLFCLEVCVNAGAVATVRAFPYHYNLCNSGSTGNLYRKKDLDTLKSVDRAFALLDTGRYTITTKTPEFLLMIYKFVTNCIMHKYAFRSLYNKEAAYIFKQTLANKNFIASVRYCSTGECGGKLSEYSAKLLLYCPFIYKILLQFALALRKRH